jgi:hypothetical protein
MRRSQQLESEVSTPPEPDDTQRTLPDRSGETSATAADPARYGQDLEARYIAVRDAWTQAMRTAGSGRAADLASLAIAQQAYEEVAAEREDWLATGRVAIPIEPASKRQDIEVAVDQELAWRDVHEHRPRGGLLARISRRFGGR